jgi:hypothetical protein
LFVAIEQGVQTGPMRPCLTEDLIDVTPRPCADFRAVMWVFDLREVLAVVRLKDRLGSPVGNRAALPREGVIIGFLCHLLARSQGG